MHFLLSTGWKNGFSKKENSSWFWNHRSDTQQCVTSRFLKAKQHHRLLHFHTEKSTFPSLILSFFIPFFGMTISATALDLISYNAENQCRSNKLWLMKFDYMFVEKFRFQKCAKFGRKAECLQSLGSSLVPVRGPVWNYWRSPLAFGTPSEISKSAHGRQSEEKVAQLCSSMEARSVQGWAMVDSR